jgi:hypothetical protein
LRIVDSSEYFEKALPALRQVFAKDDYYDLPFAESTPARTIVFGYKYVVEPPMTDAVAIAAKKVGDEGCYLSLVERSTEGPNDWYIPLAELTKIFPEGGGAPNPDGFGTDYAFVLHNVLYSPQGKWGIMLSRFYNGFLGGTQDFVDEIRRNMPGFDKQVRAWIQHSYLEQIYIEGNRSFDEDATLRVLTHVYGTDVARQILRGALADL